MQKGWTFREESALKNMFNEENAGYLISVRKKLEHVENELNEAGTKKKSALKKISADKKKTKKNTKEYRELIRNSESVLESINLIFKNLNELKKQYKSIDKSLVTLMKRGRANLSCDELKEKIQEELKELKSDEKKINEDNEKNNIIIDNYIKDLFAEGAVIEANKEFLKLTLDNLEDCSVLKICEDRVELPYTKKEIEDYMKTYPDEYKTVQDVITKEFMISISIFNKHPILARFKEAYYLCRTKEMMTIFESVNFAKSLMFRRDLNPYIIAAVKSKKQLEEYIEFAQDDKLGDYPYFKIVFEVNPLAV